MVLFLLPAACLAKAASMAEAGNNVRQGLATQCLKSYFNAMDMQNAAARFFTKRPLPYYLHFYLSHHI